MAQLVDLISRERQQYVILLGVSILVLVLVAIGYLSYPLLFQRFIGRSNPILDTMAVVLVAFLFLSILLNRGWFSIYHPGSLRGLWHLLALAPLFALVAIGVDLIARFRADINIEFPLSLVFYPTVAFWVEILFHVVPLALVMLGLSSLAGGVAQDTRIWIAFVFVALLEPVFQTVLARSSGPFPVWATVVVALNIFMINLTQLVIFRRYDFVSMFAFRLAYYGIWHILWGWVRLQILFWPF